MEMSYSGAIGPRLRREMREGVERLRILPRCSWKVVGVAAGILLFDSLKHPQWISDFYRKRDWFDDSLMVFWVVIWLVWLVAAVGEFFGTEIVSVTRGELVICRGMGALRRTFRYRAADIGELVSSDPATDEKGKRHLQHILRKPKSGSVRFEYGGKTVYFANWLDEAEGEQIVRWLKPKLPRAATELMPYEYGGAANFKP